MSVNVPREVIVDDNETGILYNGSWSLRNGQDFRNKGINPFSNSLHGTTGEADFSYSFTGSDGRIFGMITSDRSNSSLFEGQGPESFPWQCYLDGVLIPPPNPSDSDDKTDQSWPLCEWSGTPVQPHTVAIHVDQLIDGQTLWVDELTFIPDPTTVIKNSTVFVDHSDPAIQYGAGWSNQNESHIAPSRGSQLTFPFVGTSLSWFAIIPEDVPQNTSSVLFSVDDHDLTTAAIVGDLRHKDRSNKLIFQTPSLPHGLHTLKVVSDGNPDLIPLILSYFVLENSELPVAQTLPTGSSTSSAPSQSTSMPPASTSGRHSNFGDSESSSANLPLNYRVIIASVIGAVVALFFILLGILCFRRRQSKRRKQQSAETGTLPRSLEVKRQITMHETSQQEYPFSQNSNPQLESNGYNFAKRFTSGSSKESTRDRPNSLFPVSRLSILPTKGEPLDSPRTYIPRRFRFSRFSSNSRLTSASSITLLAHSSSSSQRRSSGPLSDDETAIMGPRSRDSDSSGRKLQHSRPPETHEPPPYTTR